MAAGTGESDEHSQATKSKSLAIFDFPTAVIATPCADPQSPTSEEGLTQGERERRRSRESKIATVCVDRERASHDWWPIGTELVGQIGSETFTAVVVENSRVKSGLSIQITSGPANGRVCLTPTRAALEATEEYRRSHNLGRVGGVTNGWTFWKPRT